MNHQHMSSSRSSSRSNDNEAFLVAALCIGAFIIILAILAYVFIVIHHRRRVNERVSTSAAVSVPSENDANIKKMEQCLSTKVWSGRSQQREEETTITQVDLGAEPFSQQEEATSDDHVDSSISSSYRKNIKDGPENNSLQQQQQQQQQRQQEVCAICLGAYHDGDLIVQSSNKNCQHEFHRSCIAEWLIKKDVCPCCRQTYLVHKEEELPV